MNEKTPFQKYRRWLIVGLLLVAVAVLVIAIYRPRPLLVEVATVTTGTFEQAIEEDGRLRITTRYVITAPTQAALLRPSLKVGDRVKAGDVLAILEPVAPQSWHKTTSFLPPPVTRPRWPASPPNRRWPPHKPSKAWLTMPKPKPALL
jgi:hypothetical protein